MTVSKLALATLQKLAAGGKLAPSTVVDMARSPDSPLHDHFEWDDAKAGEAYRIFQARSLIRSVRVHLVIDERVLAVPRYVHDPDKDPDQGYVEVASVERGSSRMWAIMDTEVNRAVGALARAKAVADSLGLDLDFGEALREIEALRARAEVVRLAS